MAADYGRQVFINCPFDAQYKKIFEAITFAVFDCGFQPRCARELDDGSQVRIEKILDLIESCKFGIHDISRTESDRTAISPASTCRSSWASSWARSATGEGSRGKRWV